MKIIALESFMNINNIGEIKVAKLDSPRRYYFSTITLHSHFYELGSDLHHYLLGLAIKFSQ